MGLRVLRLLQGQWRLLALTLEPAARTCNCVKPGRCLWLANLDAPDTLARLAGLADAVLHLAPPAGHKAQRDSRTQHLLQALARKGRVQCLVYASTSGVYGDAQGERFDETRAVHPATDRARRRGSMPNRRIRWYGHAMGARVSVLRIPGIYATDRPGGHPRERLLRGTPVLAAADDVYTTTTSMPTISHAPAWPHCTVACRSASCT